MAGQTLYKMRSLGSWKFVLDILVHSRLFAAPFESLNDPMEGRYLFFGPAVSKAYRTAIYQSKRRVNICSLSKRSDSTLLWSYYADGHKGVAFGVELPARALRRNDMEIRDVMYDSAVSISRNDARRSPDELALRILTQKQMPWQHEREVRVFARDTFIPVTLTELVLGCRISQSDEDLLRRLVTRLHPKIRIRKLRASALDHPEAVTRPVRAPALQ